MTHMRVGNPVVSPAHQNNKRGLPQEGEEERQPRRMKYRVKVVQVDQAFVVIVPDEEPVTVRKVKVKIDEWLAAELDLTEVPYQLSQNRTTPLLSKSDDIELSTLHVVSGDILYVINIPDARLTSRKRPRTMPAMCDQDTCRVNRYMSELLTVSESTVDALPEPLWNAVDQATRKGYAVTPADIAVVAMHVLMLETGFVPYAVEDCRPEACERETVTRFDVRNVRLHACLADPRWKGNGTYRLEYTPWCCRQLATLVVVKMGKVLLVHGTSPVLESPATLQLDPADHVLDPSLAATTPQIFRDLRLLATRFKNAVSDPLMTGVVRATHGRAANCWEGLAAEVTLRIAGYMDVRTLVNLGRTCSEMATLVRDQSLWKKLMLREFPRQGEVLLGGARGGLQINWRTEYKRCYERRVADTRSRCQLFPIPFDPLDDYFGPPVPGGPFQPGGVIDPLNPLRPPRGFLDPQQPPGPPRHWFRESPHLLPEGEIPFFWAPGFF